MPALPLDEAGKYVAAAYLVFFAFVLLYVAIMAKRLGTIEKELNELKQIAEREDESSDSATQPGGRTE